MYIYLFVISFHSKWITDFMFIIYILSSLIFTFIHNLFLRSLRTNLSPPTRRGERNNRLITVLISFPIKTLLWTTSASNKIFRYSQRFWTIACCLFFFYFQYICLFNLFSFFYQLLFVIFLFFILSTWPYQIGGIL